MSTETTLARIREICRTLRENADHPDRNVRAQPEDKYDALTGDVLDGLRDELRDFAEQAVERLLGQPPNAQLTDTLLRRFRERLDAGDDDGACREAELLVRKATRHDVE